MTKTIVAYFDGLCEPINPGGTATYGYVIYKDEEVIKKGCEIIGRGKGMTNNVAEYTGLLKIAEWLKDQEDDEIIIIKGDSQLVINQMKGLWKIKSTTSKHFVPKIQNLLQGKNVRFMWIPREQNEEADSLSRDALHNV